MLRQSTAPPGSPDWIIEHAAPLSAPRAHPPCVLLVGLPGSGKTTFARALRERTAITVIESDAVRAAMFAQPAHTKAESGRVFASIHEALRRLLERGAGTLVDATNLIESERAAMYRIAEKAGARPVVVRLTAPVAVVRKRLAARPPGESASKAGVAVFEQMRVIRQPIPRPHYIVDTTHSIEAAVAAVAREIIAA